MNKNKDTLDKLVDKLESHMASEEKILSKLAHKGTNGSSSSTRAFGGIFAIAAVLGSLAAIFVPMQNSIEDKGKEIIKLDEKLSPVVSDVSAMKQRFEKVQAQLDANKEITKTRLKSMDERFFDNKDENQILFRRLLEVEKDLARLKAILEYFSVVHIKEQL